METAPERGLGIVLEFELYIEALHSPERVHRATLLLLLAARRVDLCILNMLRDGHKVSLHYFVKLSDSLRYDIGRLVLGCHYLISPAGSCEVGTRLLPSRAGLLICLAVKSASPIEPGITGLVVVGAPVPGVWGLVPA